MEAEEEIKLVKRQVMEWLEDVAEGRYYVEECKKNQVDTEEIGNILDAEKEQDILDCEEEGNEADPMYEHLDLGNHNEQEFSPSTKWCKTIELKEEENLIKEAQNLDQFQRKTLDIGLKYARGIVKARHQGNGLPEAPNVIVVGGAGSGKSTVIFSLTQWVHKILQTAGDDPQSPYILTTATTGAASVIVEGLTLHSAMGFDFSNKHNSLSDKKQELMRDRFKNVKVIIVDEFSMMKVELLYRLDLRMKELKRNSKVFGGVSVFLLGDPAQLKPVLGTFIFDKPKTEDYLLAFGDGSDSLWRSFKVIMLTENHRQGNDKIYGDMLNRIRIGQQNQEDLDLLKTRVRSKNHPDLKNALYIACKKKGVTEHNKKCLNTLQGNLYENKSINFTSAKKNFKPPLTDFGTIGDTQFVDKLHLKIGARVMLIFNVDVSDLLCNGAMGTLVGVEPFKDGSVDKLVVKFDNSKAGRESRKSHPNYAKKFPEGTVIKKMEYEISRKANTVIGSSAKLIQYPLILAYAVTVHKIQGQTIERPWKCVVDLTSVFEGAQAYVMLSRVKELDQIFILGELPENKMYPIPKALIEIKRLEEISINNNPTAWDKKSTLGVTKISLLNTRSLVNKFENIRCDFSLHQSDIMILVETWIPEISEERKYVLKNFETHLNSAGRGKGIAVYSKKEFHHNCDLNDEHVSITKMESEDIDVIAIYRSKEGSLKELINKLKNLISYSKTTLVIGDMNICNKEKPNNHLNTYLTSKTFKQIVTSATHIDGGHIDHCYIMNVGNYEERPAIDIIPKYYSDHDSICISWKKCSNQ